ADLHTTVYPFILRGVNLLGIDSNTCPTERRIRAWQRLNDTLEPATIARMTSAVISLDDVPAYSERILDGGVRGRIVVDLSVWPADPIATQQSRERARHGRSDLAPGALWRPAVRPRR